MLNFCECGCEEEVKSGRRFINGRCIRVNNQTKTIESRKKAMETKSKEIRKGKRSMPKPKYCECGCGQIVKEGDRFIHGHNAKLNPPMKGKHHTREAKQKVSESKKGKTWEEIYGEEETKKKRELLINRLEGKHLSDEVKEKISKEHKGKHHSEERRKKESEAQKGKILSDETKRKISEAFRGIDYEERYGIEKAKKLRANRGNYIKGKTFEEVFGEEKAKIMKEEISKAATGRIKTDEEIRKLVKANSSRLKPNKTEQRLNNILRSILPKEYKLNVKGNVMILANKIPDFVNINGQKKIIELYGDYWHRNDNPQDRIDLFKQYGWDCLVIWESELKDERAVINRVLEFHGLPFQRNSIQLTMD